ncbi:MAG: hypothetical protein E7125_08935 [Bacteroidales bacterium]|nr:hypothetical protein [Bacteroidales bacterium]
MSIFQSGNVAGASDINLTGKYVKLTADISVGEYMLGADNPFRGIFDGNGHTVTYRFKIPTDHVPVLYDYRAPFRFLGDGAVIKNLHVTGLIESYQKYNAGLVSEVKEDATVTISNCRVSMTLDEFGPRDADATNGGIVAHTCSGSVTTITDCLFDGTFKTGGGNYSDYCGGLVGYKNGKLVLINCLFRPSSIDITTTSHCKTLARYNDTKNLVFENCYYTQTFGEAQGRDASGMSDNELLGRLGSNWQISGGNLVPATIVVNPFYGSGTEQDPYLISSPGNWNYLSEKVRTGNTYSGKFFKLVTDISVNTMVGVSNSKYFGGTFDGGGNTLVFNYTSVQEYCAPFRYIHGATIKNLQTAGEINAMAKYAAGIAGYAQNINHITSCRSSVTIMSSIDGDGSHGGLVGEVVKGYTDVYFEDCLFDGVFSGANTEKWGGFVGWNEDGPDSHFYHCLFAPSSVGIDSDGCYTYARRSKSGDIHFYEDKKSYYTVLLNNEQGWDGRGKSAEELVSLLGANWEVSLGSAVPKFTKSQDIKNFPGNGTLEDPYLIAEPAHWFKLVSELNGGDSYNGRYFKLVADLTISKMAGLDTKPFSGVFDGDGHILTLNLTGTSEIKYVALFGCLDGATIKNLHLAGNVTSDQYPAAVAAYVSSNGTHRPSTIVNCENSAAIHSASSGNVYAGSYVGCVVAKNYSGLNEVLIIDACSFLGSIDLSAGKSGGGFIGMVESSGSVRVKYCLFTPSSLSIKEINDSDDGKFYMFGPNLSANSSCYNSLALDYRSPTGNKPLVTSYQGQLIRTVSGGDYITVAMDGTPTEHNVSGITTYKNGNDERQGFVYGNEICGGEDFYLYLLLSYGGDKETFYAYVANNGNLSGTETTRTNDHYTLSMSNHNTVISATGVVVLRDDVDNSAVITQMAGQSNKNVTVGRTFVHGAWNSICLPFNVSAATVSKVFGDATQLRRLGSSEFTDGALSLTFENIAVSLSGTIIIEAGKPYLIKPSKDADVVNPVFGGVTIVNSSTPTVTDVATFTPVINVKTLPARDMTILFITGDGQLSFPLNNESIKGFRAYIKLTGAAAGQ